MEEKILTKHPDRGKKGVNISRAKYDTVREAILAVVRERGEITFDELGEAVEKKLRGRLDGSIMWYVTTVKLDLEARKVIRRVPKSTPQRIRLA
jgi:hypothetical protein